MRAYLYDAVAIVLFTSLEKHIDEASPALLTLDVLGLFVLGFFGSFVFGVIPGAWSPGVTTKQSISVCSRITRSAPCVSPHISRLPSHSSGVLSGIVSLFFLQFMLEKAFRTLAHFVGNLFFGGSMWSALCPCGAPSWFFLGGRCPCCAVATGCSLLVIVHSCGYWTSLLGPRGSDYTGAVLGLGDCVFCRCRGLFYALHLEGPQVQLIFKDVDLPVVAQWLFPWSRPFGCSLCSPSCRTRGGFSGCAVASSATNAVLSINVAVLTQRQVPAALCAGWAPGPVIDLSVGSV